MKCLEEAAIVFAFASATRKAGPKHRERMRPVFLVHPCRHGFWSPTQSKCHGFWSPTQSKCLIIMPDAAWESPSDLQSQIRPHRLGFSQCRVNVSGRRYASLALFACAADRRKNFGRKGVNGGSRLERNMFAFPDCGPRSLASRSNFSQFKGVRYAKLPHPRDRRVHWRHVLVCGQRTPRDDGRVPRARALRLRQPERSRDMRKMPWPGKVSPVRHAQPGFKAPQISCILSLARACWSRRSAGDWRSTRELAFC